MYRSLVLCLLFACGLTRIEIVGDGDGDAAAVDAATLADATSTSDAEDADGVDARSVDAAVTDAPRVDAPSVLEGNCAPTISACPNQAARLEMGVPQQFTGALVRGLADDVASSCGGTGTSDWTFAVTAAEAGLLEMRFSSAVSYAIEVRDGGCEGRVQTCGSTNSTQTALGIDDEQTLVLVLEAVTSCDVPFDLRVTLLPR
ncbi:MAG: hypothetical protein AB8H86_02475 [Polyangiales bacterium]